MRRRTWLRAIGLVALLLQGGLSLSAPAQSQELRQDLQSWNVITLRKAVGPGKRILLYMEAQPRIGNLDSSGTKKDDYSQLLLRPMVGYKINRHLSVGQGYAWKPSFQPRSQIENRIFQQVQVNGKLKKFKLSNRTRLEQRWIEGTHGTGVRLRDQFRVSYPLGKSEQWSLVAYNELFINLNSMDNGPSRGIDQNRAFIGVNRKLSQHVSAEAGYMNNWVNKKDPVPDRMNHIILMTLSLNL